MGRRAYLTASASHSDRRSGPGFIQHPNSLSRNDLGRVFPLQSTRTRLSPPTSTFGGMTYARIRGEAGTLGMVALGVMLALLI